MSEEVLKRIDTLAAKLGATGERLWEILVRQAYLEGWYGVWASVTLLVISLALARLSIWAWKMAKNDDDDGPYVPLCGIAGISSVVAFVGAIVNAESIIQLLNPEYYAYRMLLQ